MNPNNLIIPNQPFVPTRSQMRAMRFHQWLFATRRLSEFPTQEVRPMKSYTDPDAPDQLQDYLSDAQLAKITPLPPGDLVTQVTACIHALGLTHADRKCVVLLTQYILENTTPTLDDQDLQDVIASAFNDLDSEIALASCNDQHLTIVLTDGTQLTYTLSAISHDPTQAYATVHQE